MAYKVLMIAPRPFFVDVGFSVQILEEYKALQQQGNEVILTCYHLGQEIKSVKVSRSLNVPWYKDPLKNVSFHYLYLDFLLLVHTFNVARRFKPDIIHAHIHEGGLIGLIVGKLLRIPVIMDIQGSMLGEYKERGLPSNKFIDAIIGFIENSINRNCDGLMVEMEMRKDSLLQIEGIDQKKIYHFKLGIDTDLFSQSNRDEKLLSSLNIPKDRKVIGYVGLLTPYQGIDYMLEAMQMILQKRKDVHLLVMGYLNLEKYKQKSSDLGLDGCVTFTGKMPYHDASKHLNLCEFAVGPKVSLQETNGKLITYMSMGLPTIVFDTPMNREYLGELGIYAKYKDSSDLAKCILNVLNYPDNYKELKVKLRERAVANFGLEGMAKNTMDMYSSVIKEYKKK
jgi:glycosyltransferase involved in cell wall biosynthesis